MRARTPSRPNADCRSRNRRSRSSSRTSRLRKQADHVARAIGRFRSVIRQHRRLRSGVPLAAARARPGRSAARRIQDRRRPRRRDFSSRAGCSVQRHRLEASMPSSRPKADVDRDLRAGPGLEEPERAFDRRPRRSHKTEARATAAATTARAGRTSSPRNRSRRARTRSDPDRRMRQRPAAAVRARCRQTSRNP